MTYLDISILLSIHTADVILFTFHVPLFSLSSACLISVSRSVLRLQVILSVLTVETKSSRPTENSLSRKRHQTSFATKWPSGRHAEQKGGMHLALSLFPFLSSFPTVVRSVVLGYFCSPQPCPCPWTLLAQRAVFIWLSVVCLACLSPWIPFSSYCLVKPIGWYHKI